jgi:hypothetical protein
MASLTELAVAAYALTVKGKQVGALEEANRIRWCEQDLAKTEIRRMEEDFLNTPEGARVRAAQEAADLKLNHAIELAKIRLRELEQAAALAERITEAQAKARIDEISTLNKFMK